ncbi:MAG TPA: T9SS type A sorting domain-containing protein [Bacteroidia bacterium]|nr:T9SS type A sorting domain-containing protein [Bacteroidia bacterium]
MDIGSLVYDENEQQLSGKNKLNIDCTNFNSGLYFITVTAGNSKVTKRLVVNK